MENLKVPASADTAISKLQDTDLSPMEETLFHAWAKANQIKKPDANNDTTDYRGIYKATNGQILPYGELNKISQRNNQEDKLQRVLQERLMDRMQKVIGDAQSRQDDAVKAERQDITHQQKMESAEMELRKAPHDLKMKEQDMKAKQMDLQKQNIGVQAQHAGNEGKRLDMLNSIVNPQPVQNATTAASPTGSKVSKPNAG